MTEELSVGNGLRQGCTLAPTLFNLYACLVVERWSEKVKDEEDVGMYVNYKMDRELFRRSKTYDGQCKINVSVC